MEIRGLSEAERLDLLMSVGTHKATRRLSPWQVARLVNRARDFQPLEVIAESLSLKDPGMLRKFLALLGLPEEVQPLVTWGSQSGFLSFSSASELSRLTNVIPRESLLQLSCAAIEHQLSKNEIQAVIQRKIRGGVDVSTAMSEIINLRPIVERQYVFIAKVPDALRVISDLDARRAMARQGLARSFGASSVLAVSVSERTITFVLAADKDGAPPGHAKSIDSESIGHFLEKVFSSGSDASNGAGNS